MRTLFTLLMLLSLTMCQREQTITNEVRSCGTDFNLAMELQEDPGLKERQEEIETLMQLEMARRSITALDVTIPVVVHVIYNTAAQNISDAQIMSQIDALNKDFARLNSDAANTPGVFKPVAGSSAIKFCVATDSMGKKLSGIERRYTTKTSWTANGAFKLYNQGGLGAWDSRYYLNIWVVSLSGYLGYATYPGGNPIADGVAIRYNAFGTMGTLISPYNKGRTATHEIAHWLNVYHIWGDAQCGNDQVNDTPIQERSNYSCPVFPHVTCGNSPHGDMFMNYMDYTNDGCMNMFTKGQVSRMEATLNTSRSLIKTSTGCKK